MRLDALIFGGGAAGLWLMDRLSREGHHVLLLESDALGTGQTVASQGIIHSGLKYTLNGTLAKSSRNIREMPNLWRDSLLGRTTPNLTRTRLRSDCCFLWQAPNLANRADESLTVRSSSTNAKISLRVVPESFADENRPEALQGISGPVVKIHEQVISPKSFVQDLATQYRDRILLIDAQNGLEFDLTSPGEVSVVRLRSLLDHTVLELRPRQVIFTAGNGNAKLRKRVGLSAEVMQRRPLHMILVRGNLPELNGHCLDGNRTRITITSERDDAGQTIWQMGGQIAEDGVKTEPKALAEQARSEITNLLPAIDLHQTEWSTYPVDRAEGATLDGSQPESIQVLCAGNVTTGWPTKLVLAPVLAQEIASRASSPYISAAFDTTPFEHWPRPEVAVYPWEELDRRWWKISDAPAREERRAA